MAVRLLAINGNLYFPLGRGGPSMLMRFYDAGDMDTVPWPFPEDRQNEMARRLARALYDERETNDYWMGDTIELPDGTPFDFDNIVE